MPIFEEGPDLIEVPLDHYRMCYDAAPWYAQAIMVDPDTAVEEGGVYREAHLAWWVKILMVAGGTAVAVVAVKEALK